MSFNEQLFLKVLQEISDNLATLNVSIIPNKSQSQSQSEPLEYTAKQFSIDRATSIKDRYETVLNGLVVALHAAAYNARNNSETVIYKARHESGYSEDFCHHFRDMLVKWGYNKVSVWISDNARVINFDISVSRDNLILDTH